MKTVLLEKIIADHKEWLESGGHRGVRLDLSGADLRDALFLDTNLNGSQFGGSSLQNANLRNTDLSGVDFTYAKVSGRTVFRESNIGRREPSSKGRER